MRGKIIGRGAFTKCREHKTDATRVFLETTCTLKECIYLFNQEYEFSPKYYNREYDEIKDVWVFEAERYEKTRSLKDKLKPKYWKLYQHLRKLANDSVNFSGISGRYTQFSGLIAEILDWDIDEELKEDVYNYLSEFTNYSSCLRLEISPRNVFIKNGALILADVVFCTKQLQEARASKHN